jgi:aminoglycoside 3-N-acetyltransferase
MSVSGVVRAIVPEPVMEWARSQRKRLRKRRVARRPPLTADALRSAFTQELGLVSGDTVFVHSALGELNLAVAPEQIIEILREVVGDDGTILFPTYPRQSAHDFLKSGEVFDVRRSASFTGLLTELARRHQDAVRSLHPTKSVCAIGRHAVELTDDHPASPYPYDANSPYAKIMAYGGKVIGIGVATKNLSFVHCVDDAMKEDFPVQPYHPEPLSGECIDAAGERVTVLTFTHDMRKIDFDVPGFMRAHVPRTVCEDMTLCGAPFFRADARPLFDRMVELAGAGVTIYPEFAYKGRTEGLS